MACKEFKWQKATHDDIEKAIRWAQNIMNLRDWQTVLLTGTNQPQELLEVDNGPDEITTSGMLAVCPDRLRAWIWVPLDRCKVTDENPFDSAFHEIIHIWLYSVGLGKAENDELLCRTISPLLYLEYCHETGRKIMEEK